MRHRVAVLFDNLGPYHIARLKACTKVFETLAIEYKGSSVEYAWASASSVPFERVTLSETPENPASSALLRFEQSLDAFRPAAIAVPGWASTFALTAIRWANGANVPIVMMSDSQEIDFERFLWKEFLKKRLLRFCSAALVGGEPHREYLVKLGMPRDSISVGYDVVDNDYFATGSNEARARAQELRVQLKLPDQYFLCSARFIPKKNLVGLLRAYRHYLDRPHVSPTGQPKWSMVLLGDGEQRPEIEATISELDLLHRVYLPGFRQIEELPAFYALATGFILPSTTEQWGLVVNEAMASGLPVLVSERCGCAPDLVKNGSNGFTFDPYDVGALASLMERIASRDCDRATMGKASLEIIDRWLPETFATGLKQAVEVALAAPRRKVGILDRGLLTVLVHR